MRTGIIGTGRIGTVLARILVAAGHHVVLANARGPQTLGPLVAELGPAASAGGPPPAPPPRQKQGGLVARARGPGLVTPHLRGGKI
ncbi:NAD(P)-binding domain-containing protein, partial [Streptomyces sp. NPDC058874]|uniref:NAD(P)-binding domain-containing protein n=1 Tax=Streptomyces sp. NPDC058874 TaxID=3346662 RepID=UPI0036BC2681